jgi:hypothetical protein
MTFFLNRFFALLFLMGMLVSMGQTQATWETPFQFPASGGSIGLGSDANGNAIVVLDDSGTVEAFYYSSVTDSWTGPTILGTDNKHIVVDMDPSGTALAVWQDSSFNLHSSFFNGTTWTTGVPDPFATAAGTVQGLTIDMNGPTSALVTWIDFTSFAYTSNFFHSGAWGPSIVISTGAFIKISADFSSNGSAVASYLFGPDVFLSNFIGGSWQLLPGHDLVNSQNNAIVGIDSNGHAVAIWTDGSNNLLSSSYFGNPLVGWTAPVQISNTPNIGFDSLSLDMSPPLGTAVATWVDGTNIGWSSSHNGMTWGTPQIFASPVDTSRTVVNVNDKGDALVLFQSLPFTTEDGNILSSRLPLGGVWTFPEIVNFSNGGPSNRIPALFAALSDNGFGFAAWDMGNTTLLDYFASVERAGPSPVPAPPASINSSTCKNKFATQTDCVHFIAWTPSPTPTVISYAVARNGILIATVPATAPLSIVDVTRCKQVDVYTVTAIDANGLSSSPVTVVVR